MTKQKITLRKFLEILAHCTSKNQYGNEVKQT